MAGFSRLADGHRAIREMRVGVGRAKRVTQRPVQPLLCLQTPFAFGTGRRKQLSQEVVVGIGVSLILIAVGAVLAFAVHVTTSGFNVNTVGYILLVVGAIGALISLMFWSSWGGVGGGRRRTVVEDEVV